VEIEIKRHLTPISLLVVEFELQRPDSGITVYLQIKFRKDGDEKLVWFGYSSGSVGPFLHPGQGQSGPAEITIPSPSSGPGVYMLVDNLHAMVKQRLGAKDTGPMIIEKVRLRGSKAGGTIVSRLIVTQ
jgi:hypothetical protein